MENMKESLKNLTSDVYEELEGKLIYLEGTKLIRLMQKNTTISGTASGVIACIYKAPFLGLCLKVLAGATLTKQKIVYEELNYESGVNIVLGKDSSYRFILLEDTKEAK